ncbi:MAG TPA: hypothetical protein VFN71_15670 [Methylomirabilota bacterium]|nr:hypothetical protein [Methylomirabilota bacterium]
MGGSGPFARPHGRIPLTLPVLRRAAALSLLPVSLAVGCSYPVEGRFMGRELGETGPPARTILILYNHGFSPAAAGRYRPWAPPIIREAQLRNPDVVVFAQVRNASHMTPLDHASFAEAAVEEFRRRGVPPANIILAGQSCGAWGSLVAAAFTYPDIGGVLAIAPTCHGRLPHYTAVRDRRAQQIAQIAERARFPGRILLYEGDLSYTLEEWDQFERVSGALAPDLRIQRIRRKRVLEVCGARCQRDSHPAVLGPGFAPAFYAADLQPLIEQVRAGIRAREGQ